MDDKEALRLFLANEDYMSKMHKLSWKALSSLFHFFLNQILCKGHVDNTDIENLIHCFGVIFVRKNMSEFKMFRQEALKVSKIYMLEKIFKIANEKYCEQRHQVNSRERKIKMNESFMKNITKCLIWLKSIRRVSNGNRRKSIVTVAGVRRVSVRKTSIVHLLNIGEIDSTKSSENYRGDNRFVNLLKKLDIPTGYDSLFTDSLCYLLSKYGTQLQDNMLLDRLAVRIAKNFFISAKKTGKFDLSELDPLVGDTSCQIRATVFAAMPILAEIARDIKNFNVNQIDRETKIFIGKCLMLTQKIPDEDALENILSIIRQQTPTHLPLEWCKQMFIREGNIRDAKRVFIKLKRDVAHNGLDRLEGLVKQLKHSKLCDPLLEVLTSSKREKSSLGIEMAPMYLTSIAMIEIAKEKGIPICFHVLNSMFYNDKIEFVKWDLIYYVFNPHLNRFEKRSNHIDSSELVIAVKNIWYEGSDEMLNYGKDFLDRHFNMENYIETWKGHSELSSRMVDLRERFLNYMGVNKQQESLFDFPGSFEYLKLKEEMNGNNMDLSETLNKISRLSFMFVTHVYPSSVGVEKNLSINLNNMEFKPCIIAVKPSKVAEKKFFNKFYWEKSSSKLKSEIIAIRKNSHPFESKQNKSIHLVSDIYRKHSLMTKGILEEDELEEEI